MEYLPKTLIGLCMNIKIKQNKQRIGDKLNIYQCVVYDENDKEVEFNITNNGQSSSILPFGSHARNHPHVKVVYQYFKNYSLR